MLHLAEQIDAMPLAHQQAFSLCATERMLVAKSHFVEPSESPSVNCMLSVIDDLWQFVINGKELTADEQGSLRLRINETRPPKQRLEGPFPLRDVCWMLKSVVNVFRDREHAYDIARLGQEMATRSNLDEDSELQNQQQIINRLVSFSDMDDDTVSGLGEYIRVLPLTAGREIRAERGD